MKYLCNIYIKRAGWIGAFYCAIPTFAWFVSMLIFVPFRGVYLLRLGLCLVVGCPLAAYFNRYSVQMWLAKHLGTSGPATILDGALNGGAVGVGSALLPALTALIGTNHPEMAKTFIIVTYVSCTLVGGIMGSSLASVGRKYANRNSKETG